MAADLTIISVAMADVIRLPFLLGDRQWKKQCESLVKCLDQVVQFSTINSTTIETYM